MAEYKGNYFREDFKTYDQGDWLTGTWSNAKNSWNQASTRAENVTHDRNDDTLTLRLGAENDRGKEYNGASVQTKDYFHFGIYEINMKASGVHGVNSNFFTFTGKQQGTIKNEIDFEFLGKTPTKVWTSFHSPNANAAEGYEGRGKNVDLGFDASKGFHTYRFEWKSNSIKWYADGKLIRSVDPDKDVWLENGKYVTDYDAGNNGDTGAEMGIPQLPGKMYMNIWAGATQWMGKTPSNFSETTATYDHITYMAWDHPNAKSFGNGKSGASVKVTEPSSSKVDAVDAVYDTATAQENRSIKLDLLDNDQGDNLKITKVENVTNGTAKINGDGTVTYTPDAGFHGREDFSYTISDGSKTDKAWVGVTVKENKQNEPVNVPTKAPTKNTVDADAIYDTATTQENRSIKLDLLDNDKGGNLTISKIANVSNGSVKINSDGTVTYTPNVGFSGRENFSYTISDGVNSDTAWVGLTVEKNTKNAPAKAPTKNTVDADAIYDTATTQENRSIKLDLLDNDKGDNLRITKVENVTDGTVKINSDGTVTYTPDAGFHGREDFSYTISDGSKTDKAWVGLKVEESKQYAPVQAPEKETPASNKMNAINGGSKRDTLRGTNDDDIINGKSGDGIKDKLYGRDGDDILIGGYKDVLNGGSGKDTFVLESDSTKQTRIEDFNIEHDILDISDILGDVNGVEANIRDFISIETNQNKGKTYLLVDQDGAGRGGEKIVAQVDGLSNVDIEDLIANNALIV